MRSISAQSDTSAARSAESSGIRVVPRRFYADDPAILLLKPPFFQSASEVDDAPRPRRCWNDGEATVSGTLLGELIEEWRTQFGMQANRTSYEAYRRRAILWRGKTKKLPLAEMDDPRYFEARVCHLDPSGYSPAMTEPVSRMTFALDHATGDSLEDDRLYARYRESWSHAEWFFSRSDQEREFLVGCSRKAGVRYFKPNDPPPDPAFFRQLKEAIFHICGNKPKG